MPLAEVRPPEGRDSVAVAVAVAVAAEPSAIAL
jgi:hypothetical protein